LTPLTAMDVAETIVFALTRPAHVNISDILLMPTDQATATLVDRR
jgi:3-hydroxy acid dehydrogenase / malonic semialdehyde reductase